MCTDGMMTMTTTTYYFPGWWIHVLLEHMAHGSISDRSEVDYDDPKDFHSPSILGFGSRSAIEHHIVYHIDGTSTVGW